MKTRTTTSSLVCYVFALVLVVFFYFDGLGFVTQLVRYVLVSVLALFIISLLLSVRFFSTFPFFFTFTVFYIHMYFSPWYSNRFSQCYYIGVFEIKIKFNYLLFWFYYTFPYVSTTLTRFPFSACPVGDGKRL